MPTQNVNLTHELDAFVKHQVNSGDYNNASEVHRAALSAMKKQEEERQLKFELLRLEIQKGVNDIEGGRYTTVNDSEGIERLLENCKNQARSQLI